MTSRQILWFAGSDWWVHNTYSEKRYARIYAREGSTVLFVNSISIGVPALTRVRHYGGLRSVRARLERLLAEFPFTSIAEGVGRGADGRGTPVPAPGVPS